jgi:hypothetical protein
LRHSILAASAFALLCAAPAFAQPPRDDALPPPPHAVRHLPPPNAAEQYGDRIGRVADALMAIDIGPLVDAIEPGARYRGAPTSLGDIATRRDPYARARMHSEIAATSAGLGAAARDAAVIAPLARQALARAMRDIDLAARSARARYGEVPPPPPPGYYEDEPGY